MHGTHGKRVKGWLLPPQYEQVGTVVLNWIESSLEDIFCKAFSSPRKSSDLMLLSSSFGEPSRGYDGFNVNLPFFAKEKRDDNDEE